MKRICNTFTFLVALFAIGSFLYYHGFQCSHEFKSFQILTVKFSFAIFLVAYLAQCWSSSHPLRFVKKAPFEGLLLGLATVEVLLTYLSPYSLSGPVIDLLSPVARNHVLILLYQSVLVLLAFIELAKRWSDVNDSVPFTLSPAWLFVLSYVLLIVGGSCLLKMPEMTASGQSMDLIDALFTSVSANCVTGLIVVDTATFFSPKGHALLMFLIQLGGLNIISFAVYFAFFFQKGDPARNKNLAADFLHLKTGPNLRTLLTRVISISLIAEIVGATFLYLQWQDSLGSSSRANRLFFSFFHSVSAFNNSGFTLFTGNLTNPLTATNYAAHTTIAMLIVLGGLGFPVIMNLGRLMLRKERLSIDSKLALSSASVLILLGASLLLVFEPLEVFRRGDFIAALFQSVTSRTAGFNTISLTSLSLPSLFLMITLMFIGASSASTGGGVKTSTFVVALKGWLSRTGKKSEVSLYREILPFAVIRKATAITIASLATIVIGATLLILIEPTLSPLVLVFEAFSAFGTAGLSLNVTPNLSNYSKVIVMILIFVGRVGPLALTAALLAQNKRRSEIGTVMIG